jgi:D-alanine-D-alanine ligase-like ATP-grasp enzyme
MPDRTATAAPLSAPRTRGFADRLRSALVGDPAARFVYLANFEVEDRWADGENGLPRTSFEAARHVVNRMDELAVTLAGSQDHVLLKAAPDPGYLDCLARLDLPLPGLVTAASAQPQRNVTEDALATPDLVDRLAELAAQGAYLLPHGVSAAEEELAGRAGLPLAAPPAAICKLVNSKVYSRRLADRLGLRQPTGWACADLEEFAAACRDAGELLADGRRVVVKDAYGVSGKGLVVVEDANRLDRLHRMVAAQVRRSAGVRVGLVVEEWVAKGVDLNYQFTVHRDGTVSFDFVKEAYTVRGVHTGHRFPARLSEPVQDELRRCAQALGAQLAADGYYGVVGVDAMTDPDGGLYPVTEINARNNMSTYQATLIERLVSPQMVALARQYPLRLAAPLPFDRLREGLGELLLDRAGGVGLVVHAFATVNAGAGAQPFPGRLYGLLTATSTEELDLLDTEVAGRLAVLAEGV